MTKKYILLLLLLGFIVYFSSLFNGFVWDDEEQILNNTAVHSISSIPSFFFGSTFNTGGTGKLGGVYYRPLMMITFAVLYQISGAQAFLFHLVQLCLHLAIGILLFFLFKRFFKEPIAFFLAAIYLIHPINVESVAYIAAIQDVAYVFFLMLILVYYLYGRQKITIKAMVISGFMLCALLSKEVAITFIIPFIGYIYFHDRKHLKHYILAIIAPIILYIFMRFVVAQVYFIPFDFAPIVRTTLIQRILMIPTLFWSYIHTVLWPDHLSVMQHWIVTKYSFSTLWGPLLIILLLIAGVIWSLVKTKSSTLLFLLTMFVCGISPYMQLFPLDMTVADRWFYYPFIGLLGIVGFYLASVFDRMNKTFFYIFVSVIVLAFSIRTIVRIQDWKSGYTLYSHDVLYSHNSFDLENNLGVELFRKGDIDNARKHFKKSTELAPTWWVNWNNLGATYERKHDLKTAEKYYKKALDNGDYYLAYQNYAGILIKLNREQEAMNFLRDNAMHKFPYNATLVRMYEYLQGMGYN